MELDLDGKTALITGGSKGIGLGIASTFAQAGAKIMIVSRKPEGLEEAVAEIGHGSRWTAGNVGDPADAQAAVQATLDAFESIDILINNAAANPYAGPMIDADLSRWNKTIQVNLTAPLIWTQLVWEQWMKENGGSIVNISSVAAKKSSKMLGVYGMTKAALLYQTKQLAVELAPTTRVNAICPGLIRTDFARALWEGEQGEKITKSYPLKRLGEPSDIANAALYFASDASSWVTGQCLVADGGSLINYIDR